MDWENDKSDVFSRATNESVPPSIADNRSKSRSFGITSNTQFSPGLIIRKTSQTYKQSRGVEPPVVQSNQSVQNKTRVIPGLSLSTHKGNSTMRRTNGVWEKLAPAEGGNSIIEER